MKNFTISELCTTSTGIANVPNAEQVSNLELLVEKVLDPAREALAKPISVNSGFRCQAVNSAVKGAATSQHTTGQAADVELGGKTPAENQQLYEWIKDNCEFDQLINEYNFSWVHVSYRATGNRNMVFSIG